MFFLGQGVFISYQYFSVKRGFYQLKTFFFGYLAGPLAHEARFILLYYYPYFFLRKTTASTRMSSLSQKP